MQLRSLPCQHGHVKTSGLHGQSSFSQFVSLRSFSHMPIRKPYSSVGPCCSLAKLTPLLASAAMQCQAAHVHSRFKAALQWVARAFSMQTAAPVTVDVALLERAFSLDVTCGLLEPAHAALSSTSSMTIHQGSATAKGPFKRENQDRVVALLVLEDLLAAGPTTRVAASAAVNSTGGVGSVSAYSAIFDGHGGAEAATYAAKRLHQIVAERSVMLSYDACRDSIDSVAEAAIQEAAPNMAAPQLQQAWKAVFSLLDDEFLGEAIASGCEAGSTALAGIHAGTNLVIAHAGDSRAVLCRGGAAVRLTQDHKPDNTSEKQRIEAAGGRVRCCHGTWRVLLPLGPNMVGQNMVKLCATSRGLGDKSFKGRSLLTCEPDVTCAPLQRDVDEFSIFASDGLWGSVDDGSAVEVVKRILEETPRGSCKNALARAAAEQLIRLARAMGSIDDISVVVNLYTWEPAAA